MAPGDMAGPGGARRLKSRWLLRTTLVATSPVHLGNGEPGDVIDLVLLRDAATGAPLLTGSSLAGGLRDYACEVLLGDRVPEIAVGKAQRRAIEAVFGGAAGDAEGGQSPLIVFDALGRSSGTEVRDGVRIDPKTGVATAHFKYDLEAWPAGTTFDVRLDLVVTADVGDGDEAEEIALLALAMQGITSGDVRIGARGNRGFGRCAHGSLRAQRFSLDEAAGWESWLATWEEEPRPRPAFEGRTLLEAAAAAWPESGEALRAKHSDLERRARRRVIEVTVPLSFPHGILVGAAPDDATGADTVSLRSAGRLVLSGTSAGGALRQQVRRIASEVRAARHDDDAWVRELLGSEPGKDAGDRTGRGTAEGDGDPEPRAGEIAAVPERALVASRLRVEERVLSGEPLRVTRIQIDRFTQAPVDGALLEEEPVFAGEVELQVSLRLPEDPEAGRALSGLLLLAIKDVLLGDVPLGGTTAIGRGTAVPGVGDVRIRGAFGDLSFHPARPPEPSVRAEIESWVRAFHDACTRSEPATSIPRGT